MNLKGMKLWNCRLSIQELAVMQDKYALRMKMQSSLNIGLSS
jgi:hypothetical protein